MSASLARVAIWRWLLLLVGVILLVVALISSSSSTAQTVATVNGTRITLTDFNAWLKSSAVSAHASDSTVPPFVPDAPSYVRCIQFIGAAEKKAKKSATNSQLLTGCQALRQELSSEVMQLLISSQWILDEGAREGIHPTDAQVDQAVHSQFAKQAGGLGKFLSANGLSEEQLRFESRVSLTAQKLSSKHVGTPPTITQGQIQEAYDNAKSDLGGKTLAQVEPQIKAALTETAEEPKVEAFLTSIQQRYLPSTSCALGYRIAKYCRRES